MASNDETNDLLKEMLREMRHGGGGNSPFASVRPRRNTSKPASDFDVALRGLADGVKLMHGGVEGFTGALRNAARGVVGLEVLVELFEGAMKLSKTFSKMADVGQVFGGSMFNMAKQAGASGLSLEEFSSMMIKHSQVAAAMTKELDDSVVVSGQWNRSLAGSAAAQTSIARGAQGTASVFASLAEHATNAGSAVGGMGDQHADTSDVMAGMSRAFAGLGAAAQAGSPLVAEFNKQMAQAASAATGLAIGQGATEAAASRLKQQFTSTGQTASDVAKRQTTTAELAAKFNEQLSAVSATAQQMALDQGPTAQAALGLTSRLTEAATTAALVAAKQGDLGTLSTDLSKKLTQAGSSVGDFSKATTPGALTQFNQQLQSAATVNAMIAEKQGDVAALADTLGKQFGVVTNSTDQLVKTQRASSGLASQYDKQVAEAKNTLGLMIAQQSGAGDATERLGRQIQSVTATTGDLSKTQDATSNLITDFARNIGDASSTLSKIATTEAPKASQPGDAGKLNDTLTALRTSTTAVIQAQGMLGDLAGTAGQQMNTLEKSLQGTTSANNQAIKPLTSSAAVNQLLIKSTEDLNKAQEQAQKQYKATIEANSRNSMLENADSKKYKMSLQEMQKAVRDDIEQFGFFGMTLGEVTDAVGDYMETVRQNGLLSKMSDTVRKQGIETMLQDVSSLSVMFGKSREQIMKTTNDAMRQVNLSAKLAAEGDATKSAAARKWIEGLAAFGGKELADSAAQQIGRGGFVNSDLGLSAQRLGMTGFSESFGKMQEQIDKGIMPSTEDLGETFAKLHDEFTPERIEQLNAISRGKGEFAGDADKMLAQYQAMQNKYIDANGKMNVQKFVEEQKQAAEDTKIRNEMTRRMTTFSSTLNTITGGFLEGFYDAFDKMMGSPQDEEAFKKTVENLKQVLMKVGAALGNFLGRFLQPENLEKVFTGLSNLTAAIIPVAEQFGHLALAIGDALAGFFKITDWVKNTLLSLTGADPKGSMGTIISVASIAIPIILALMLKKGISSIVGGFLANFAGKAATGAAAGLGTKAVGLGLGAVAASGLAAGAAGAGAATGAAGAAAGAAGAAGGVVPHPIVPQVPAATPTTTVPPGTIPPTGGAAAVAGAAVPGAEAVAKKGLLSKGLGMLKGVKGLKGVGLFGIMGSVVGETARWGINGILDGVAKNIPGHDAIKNIANSAIDGAELGSTFGPMGALWGGIIGGVGSAVVQAIPSADDAKKQVEGMADNDPRKVQKDIERMQASNDDLMKKSSDDLERGDMDAYNKDNAAIKALTEQLVALTKKQTDLQQQALDANKNKDDYK